MGLNQASLRDGIWGATGTDSSDFDAGDLDNFLNLSWWEIQDKLGFREKEGEGTLSTIIGTREYDISTVSSDVESVQNVFIQDLVSEAWEPLSYKSHEWLMAERDDEETLRETPEHYGRYNSLLILHPVPDAVYTLRIRYLKTLSDLAVSGFPVPQSWHEIIRLGAEARVWHHLGDPARRDDTFAMRNALVIGATEVRVKENVSKTSAIKILRAPYP